jgi:hypothetical protein
MANASLREKSVTLTVISVFYWPNRAGSNIGHLPPSIVTLVSMD